MGQHISKPENECIRLFGKSVFLCFFVLIISEISDIPLDLKMIWPTKTEHLDN